MAYTPAGGVASVAVTVGTGNWETEACAGIASVGPLPPGHGGMEPAGLIYRAASPHASLLEPVVVTWSAQGPIEIDEATSRRASDAGATTVASIRKVLRD